MGKVGQLRLGIISTNNNTAGVKLLHLLGLKYLVIVFTSEYEISTVQIGCLTWWVMGGWWVVFAETKDQQGLINL